MKKFVLVFVCLQAALAGIWAQEAEQPAKQPIASFGFGILIGGDLGGGIESTVSDGVDSEVITQSMGNFGGGFQVFLDFKYVEASAGFVYGIGSWEIKSESSVASVALGDAALSSINLGLLLKYPFAINSKLSLFPAVAVNYNIAFTMKINDRVYGKVSDFSAIWFKFGGGLDYSFSQKNYFRLEFLYGFRMANDFEKAYTSAFDSLVAADLGLNSKSETRLGHGPQLKLAIGKRF